jgi:hypothetical protein
MILSVNLRQLQVILPADTQKSFLLRVSFGGWQMLKIVRLSLAWMMVDALPLWQQLPGSFTAS